MKKELKYKIRRLDDVVLEACVTSIYWILVVGLPVGVGLWLTTLIVVL
ncbi:MULTISPECIES: hypothetical protein [Niallia]|uniref:Uncharacterized protein n=1 Tax=Niallia circulans TaxID=1397 RepID=A0A941GB46_NIACI|nr:MULTISPECIES: hypothetical protein [Niallia]MCB5237195.1 hypothetical protein [Niallia circulans]MED3795641.1 hypothetical protein [Niallia alba]QJX65127.1 hypothetical protein HLK66_25950 [Niallia circulans]